MEFREMTKNEAQIFFTIKVLNTDMLNKMYQDLKNQSWVLQAIEKHFEARKLTVDKEVQIMILVMGDGAIGKCVKYIDYIHEQEKEVKTVTFNDFIYKYFPIGIPILK